MKAEQQYIDLFTHYEDLICRHAAGLMNLPRAEALADLERLGFPTVKSVNIQMWRRLLLRITG